MIATDWDLEALRRAGGDVPEKISPYRLDVEEEEAARDRAHLVGFWRKDADIPFRSHQGHALATDLRPGAPTAFPFAGRPGGSAELTGVIVALGETAHV